MAELTHKKTELKGVLILIITAFIWGTAFVAQSEGMENIEAFTFSGIRMLMGAAVLVPFVIFRERKAVSYLSADGKIARKKNNVRTVKNGIFLGVVLCIATNFQQFAFNYSTSGKIAFITALYMFFVPLLGLVLKKKVSALTWVCTVLGVIGLFFLCVNPNDFTSVNLGDVLSLACAFFFAVHILFVERISDSSDGLTLSCVQFTVAGIISCVLMLIFENPEAGSIKSAMLPLFYSGVMSCGIAYTLQIVGQKYTQATVASLIMCSESVFAVLAAAIILKEIPTPMEIFGCVTMFTAILLSQSGELIIKQKINKKRG